MDKETDIAAGHNLVVVESPHKARRIQVILDQASNKAWKVVPTFGHFVDLPKKELGVDPSNAFALAWITTSKATAKKLNAEAKKATLVFICTDPDREGEGIAQHVYDIMINHLDPENIYRATFNELTPQAVIDAVTSPGRLDPKLVAAQQARRACDRLIGYMISPVLWRQVGDGTTAGRVQSCVLNELVKRTRQRRSFVSQDQFYVHANLVCGGVATSERFQTSAEAQTLLDELKQTPVNIIEHISTEEHEPPSIFKTSQLLTTAHTKYNFSSSFTMTHAQRLFELGLITYHRTTSEAISPSVVDATHETIKGLCSQQFCSSAPRLGASSGAHEGIRACNPRMFPSQAKLDADCSKLYELIWARMLASQSVSAKVERQLVEYSIDPSKDAPATLTAKGFYYTFDGWHKPSGGLFKRAENKLDSNGLDIVDLEIKHTTTQPPSRYTEASLIRWMEKKGIGRPSTYAYILRHLQERFYAGSNGSGLDSRLRGEFITTFLNLVDDELLSTSFTSELEENLDAIATGQQTYVDVVSAYHKYLEPFILKAKTVWLTTSEKCPGCSKAFGVWIDKKDEPYLWCKACDKWVWAEIDKAGKITEAPSA